MTPSRAFVAALLLSAASPLTLVATAPTAIAQEQLDVALPHETFTLDNGLTVVVHEDRKAPVVALQVMYGVGSKDEPTGKTGFAHLFEHLMFNGSENFDKDFFFALKEMGATQYNGTTNTDRTNYYQTVPTGALEQILFLESDRMGHLLGAVTQEKLDQQIGVVQNEKRVGEDRPFGKVWEVINAALYPQGHPYHHSVIGSMEDLSNATLEDVKEWFRKYYGAANAVLVLAGDISAEEARPLVEKYFGDIEAGPPLTKPASNAVPLTTNKIDVMFDRVSLPRVYRHYIAPPTGDPESPILDIAAKVLGGGKTSRLYKRLVDDLQIANSVTVYYGESLLSGEMGFIVDAKSPAVIGQINDVIDEEIARLLDKGITKDELERAKTIFLAGTVRGLEAVRGKAATLARGTLFVGDPDFYVVENVDRLQAASARDVQMAARGVLSAGYHELQVLPYPEYSASEPGYDRTAGLPPIGEGASIEFPEVAEATLSNGMRLVVASRPTVPVVEVAIQFDAGGATDAVPVGGRNEALRGIADMAQSLMDDGAGKWSAAEIAEREEQLGAQIGIYSGADDTKAYMSALKTNLTETLDLFTTIVTEPSFPEDELEKARNRMIDGLRQEKADLASLGFRTLQSTVYGEDHAYGTYPTATAEIAALEKITRDDLLAWHQAWMRPESATIFVTGDITVAEAKPALEEAFGDWSVDGAAPEKAIADIPAVDERRLIIVDKPGTQQAQILGGRLIAASGQETDTALRAMNDAFGGNFLSRINMNIREDKGWSYGVRSGAGDAVGQRMFYVYAPVQIDKAGASVGELLKEMQDLTTTRPPTEIELDRTVASVVGAAPGQFETARSVLFSMSDNAIYGRPYDYDVSEAARFEQLGVADISSIAKDIIQPQAFTWVIVGDWSVIEPQLTDYDLGEIEVRRAGE